jgi:hypothetical protein
VWSFSKDLDLSHALATFKMDALRDQGESVEILQDALSAIDSLSDEANIEALPEKTRKAVNKILDTLEL